MEKIMQWCFFVWRGMVQLSPFNRINGENGGRCVGQIQVSRTCCIYIYICIGFHVHICIKMVCVHIYIYLPVVPHKAVAEVSK